jgi:hypothetical protein
MSRSKRPHRIKYIGSAITSPLYADGKIYFFSRRGQVTVIAADRSFEPLAKNQVDK